MTNETHNEPFFEDDVEWKIPVVRGKPRLFGTYTANREVSTAERNIGFVMCEVLTKAGGVNRYQINVTEYLTPPSNVLIADSAEGDRYRMNFWHPFIKDTYLACVYRVYHDDNRHDGVRAYLRICHYTIAWGVKNGVPFTEVTLRNSAESGANPIDHNLYHRLMLSEIDDVEGCVATFLEYCLTNDKYSDWFAVKK